jgi:chemotaxis protein MotB
MTRTLITVTILTLFMVGCVPMRKLEEEKAKRENCEKDLADTKQRNQNFETTFNEQKAKITDLDRMLNGVKRDTSILGSNYRTLTIQYDKLNQINDQLSNQLSKLTQNAASENTKLVGQLQLTQGELQKKEDQLKKLEVELDGKKKTLDAVSAELEKREQRVKELEDILKKKDNAIADLKNKVSDALTGFEGKGLTVTQRNGKVYVSMDESLLFATGSTKVEAKGVDAIKKLAKLLEQSTDVNIMVEGHTDDQAMRGAGEIKDNWDLSVMRATSVVKIITQNSGTSPKRITAAGRGEYFPIDAAKTADARKKNRRTEIILTPKLDELLKVLESN